MNQEASVPTSLGHAGRRKSSSRERICGYQRTGGLTTTRQSARLLAYFSGDFLRRIVNRLPTGGGREAEIQPSLRSGAGSCGGMRGLRDDAELKAQHSVAPAQRKPHFPVSFIPQWAAHVGRTPAFRAGGRLPRPRARARRNRRGAGGTARAAFRAGDSLRKDAAERRPMSTNRRPAA